MIRITAEICEGALAHRGRSPPLPSRGQEEEALEAGALVRLARELQTFGRRYERRVDNFLGFVHLGCIVILLRQLLR